MSANITGGSKDAASLTSSRKQTISTFFSTGQQKSSPKDGCAATGSSPSKRIKLSDGLKGKHSVSCVSATVAASSPPTTAATSFAPLQPQEMYNFPGNATAPTSAIHSTTAGKASKGDVIDLTSSDDVTMSDQTQKKMKDCVSNMNGGGRREGLFGLQNPNFTPQTGPRKIHVKNLRTGGSRSDPRQHYERIWSQLHQALGAIFRGEKVASLEELYRGVLNVCRLDFAADLAGRLERDLKDYISGTLRTEVLSKAEAITSAKGTEEEVDVLRVVLEAWETWKEHMVSHPHSDRRRN